MGSIDCMEKAFVTQIYFWVGESNIDLHCCSRPTNPDGFFPDLYPSSFPRGLGP